MAVVVDDGRRHRNSYVKCNMIMRNYLNSHPMPNHILFLQCKLGFIQSGLTNTRSH